MIRAILAVPVLAALAVTGYAGSSPAWAGVQGGGRPAVNDKCTMSVPATSCGNWAGQVGSAKNGDSVRYAEASFRIPRVTCSSISGPGPGSNTAFWAGVGGTGSDPLEQAGVIAHCASRKSKPDYSGFWEMYQPRYPKLTAALQPGGTDGTLRAGDAITVVLTYTGSRYHFTFADARSSRLGWARSARCMAKAKAHPRPAKCVSNTVEAITEKPTKTIPEMAPVAYSVTISMKSTPDYGYGLGVLRTTDVTLSPAGHAGLVKATTLRGHGNLASTFRTYWDPAAAR